MEVISCRAESRDGEYIGGSDPTSLITPIKTMTTIKTIAAASASLAAGATLMTVAGPAAQANPYNTLAVPAAVIQSPLVVVALMVVDSSLAVTARTTATGPHGKHAAIASTTPKPN